MKVGVLASGEGSNLQAILDRLHADPAAGVEVVAVGSDVPGARALERARAADIEARAFSVAEPGAGAARSADHHDRAASGAARSADHHDRAARDAALAAWLEARGVELVVLAGYMRLLDPAFLARFPQRVINVHPALLPAFPGVRAVEQALAYGVRVFGVTVHFVDAGVDTGPVIFQRALELPDATDADAVRAALRPLEHDLLCDAIRLIAAGAVGFDPDRPRRVVVAPR